MLVTYPQGVLTEPRLHNGGKGEEHSPHVKTAPLRRLRQIRSGVDSNSVIRVHQGIKGIHFMFRVFPYRASATNFSELLVDGFLCFVAVLMAAATLCEESSSRAILAELASTGVLLPAASFALTMALLYSFVGLYRHSNLSFGPVVLRVVFASVVGGYLTYLITKQTTYDGYPSQLVGFSLAYVLSGLVLYRGTAWAIRQVVGTRRVLIVGTGADARQVWTDLRSGGQWAGYQVAGFFPTTENVDASPAGSQAPVFPAGADMLDLVREHRVDEIIVAVREQRGGGVPMAELLNCRISGVRIMDLACFYEHAKAEVPLDSLKASWLVYGHGFVQGRLREITKRAFDIASSATLLLLASPLMLLTTLAIKLEGPGPVFYQQERVGMRGRSFQCIKFRSMRIDAEKDGVARWASKNDSRITRVGAFIRKTRIDELPQLISVLAGEMSMVGPRPERPSFVAQLREQIPYYDLRHTVKPGLTGWAQVRYAYGASLDDAKRKHQFDLYYVKNNSVMLDLMVLIETVSVVLFREGAH
jgi:sugar transferase (PEP-CTERM system associated)